VRLNGGDFRKVRGEKGFSKGLFEDLVEIKHIFARKEKINKLSCRLFFGGVPLWVGLSATIF
jgi:hypothetical protein